MVAGGRQTWPPGSITFVLRRSGRARERRAAFAVLILDDGFGRGDRAGGHHEPERRSGLLARAGDELLGGRQ